MRLRFESTTTAAAYLGWPGDRWNDLGGRRHLSVRTVARVGGANSTFYPWGRLTAVRLTEDRYVDMDDGCEVTSHRVELELSDGGIVPLDWYTVSSPDQMLADLRRACGNERVKAIKTDPPA